MNVTIWWEADEVLMKSTAKELRSRQVGRNLVSSWEEGFDLQPPDYKPNALTIRSYCPKVHSWFSVFAFVVVIMGYLKEVKKDKEADRYSEMKDGQRDREILTIPFHAAAWPKIPLFHI